LLWLNSEKIKKFTTYAGRGQQLLGVSQQAIAQFCQRWQMIEFAVFGSVLGSDFRPDSDIDVLVTFADRQS
jgi:predicted nucleotidyltransferase